MFPHNPKLHYQEKMMGPLSSNIIMYAVPCCKKSGKDKELQLILKFSKYPSLRHRCAIINFVYQFFPDIKQKRFPYFRGAGTAVRTLASRARVWFPDMASGLLPVLVLAPRVFLRVLRRRFLPLRINQHSKFQFDMETVDEKSHLVECSFSKCPFIYFILFL